MDVVLYPEDMIPLPLMITTFPPQQTHVRVFLQHGGSVNLKSAFKLEANILQANKKPSLQYLISKKSTIKYKFPFQISLGIALSLFASCGLDFLSDINSTASVMADENFEPKKALSLRIFVVFFGSPAPSTLRIFSKPR